MAKNELNLGGLTFMVGDSSESFRTILNGILRGFGVSNVVVCSDGKAMKQLLTAKHVDILLVEFDLPTVPGHEIVKTMREDPESPFRFIPMVVMTSHTQQRNVEKARDCGANMVIAKPISAKVLFDRLAWMSREPRPFIQAPTYNGPDRRFKIEGFPHGVGRRKEDSELDVGEEEGPALSQDEIDSLFQKR